MLLKQDNMQNGKHFYMDRRYDYFFVLINEHFIMYNCTLTFIYLFNPKFISIYVLSQLPT